MLVLCNRYASSSRKKKGQFIFQFGMWDTHQILPIEISSRQNNREPSNTYKQAVEEFYFYN